MRVDLLGGRTIRDEVRVFEINPGTSIEEHIEDGDVLRVGGREEIVIARSIEVAETIEVIGRKMVNRKYDALALQNKGRARLISLPRKYSPSQWLSCYQMAVEAGLVKNDN